MTGRLYFNRHRKKWQAIVELGRDPVTGRRRQVFRDARTKSEAREVLRRLLREIEDGTHVEPHNLTVEEHLTGWLHDVARHRVTQRSFDRYESVIRVQLVPALGAVKLIDLRPAQVQQLYSQLVDKGLSAATVLKVHTTLHSALKHAVTMGLLARNPSDNMALPRIRRREMTALGEQEIARLLAAAKDTTVEVPLLCLVTLGLRRGELLGLTWPDVDFEAAQVSVRRSLEESSAGVTLKPPKTQRSTRTLALPQVTVEALREHRRSQREERLRLGPSFNTRGLVFPGADGEPWWCSNFARACRRVFDGAGLARVRLHDLRHAHATMLLREGVHPKVVSERLGHASVALTMDVYSHVLPGMQREAAERIDESLRAALPG